MSNILVMPGTKWQSVLIHKIKESGHKVFLVDPNSKCFCHELVDNHLVADIFDMDAIEEYIADNDINAVISDECDIATPMMASIAEKHGFPTIGTEMASLYTNKYLMREFCKKNDLAYPEYCLCKKIEEAHSFYNKMMCKLIIKPLDSNSSKGVYTINSHEDIDKYFVDSIGFSRKQKVVILERYIGGTEFTVDGIKSPNEYKVLAISRKKHFLHNENIANELYFSESDPEFDYLQLKKINEQFVELSRLPFGFTHAEYKYENGKFFLIEIAARGGGNQISAIIAQFMSDIDTYSYLIDWSLGNENIKKLPSTCLNVGKSAVLKFFDTPLYGGIVKKIEGEELLNGDERIVDYSFNFKVGDMIEECASDSARIGYYIACCNSREELDELMLRIEQSIKIIIQ